MRFFAGETRKQAGTSDNKLRVNRRSARWGVTLALEW